MPQKTSIEWTDLSSNPIYAIDKETGKRGWFCTKPSTGCAHCYSEAINKRFGNGFDYAKRNESRVEFKLNEKELRKILKLRKPSRIFLGDMLDVFHEAISDTLLNQLFAVMMLAKQQTFQVLTKRADRLLQYMIPAGRKTAIAQACREDIGLEPFIGEWPPRNVWFGVSVENQETAKERIPLLKQTPAVIRFLSLEPLLEDLGQLDLTGIRWVVVGGESGPGARPCHLDWVHSIVEQCRSASVPCFVKQLGSVPVMSEEVWMNLPGARPLLSAKNKDRVDNGTLPIFLDSHKGNNQDEWPKELRVREFPQI